MFVCIQIDPTKSFTYPIRTNESQRAFNVQKLPQMTFLGLFRCKQTLILSLQKVDQIFDDLKEN